MKPIPHNSLAEEGTAARVRAPPKTAARKVFFMKPAQVGVGSFKAIGSLLCSRKVNSALDTPGGRRMA
jgi:hypothetical protein